MKIRKFDLPEMYLEKAYGTDEWYYGKDFVDDICDLYEAEDIEKSGHLFRGSRLYFIHYPDGKVYCPFSMEESVYYEAPVWDNGCFGILCVHFKMKKIILYTYVPGNQPVILKEIPLSEVPDCYNLRLERSPWILGRQTGGAYEAIWPFKKTFPLHGDESMIFRDNDTLVFSRWKEEPGYHEYYVIVDIHTGKEIFVGRGGLELMPNGEIWNI